MTSTLLFVSTHAMGRRCQDICRRLALERRAAVRNYAGTDAQRAGR